MGRLEGSTSSGERSLLPEPSKDVAGMEDSETIPAVETLLSNENKEWAPE